MYIWRSEWLHEASRLSLIMHWSVILKDLMNRSMDWSSSISCTKHGVLIRADRHLVISRNGSHATMVSVLSSLIILDRPMWWVLSWNSTCIGCKLLLKQNHIHLWSQLVVWNYRVFALRQEVCWVVNNIWSIITLIVHLVLCNRDLSADNFWFRFRDWVLSQGRRC